MTTLLKRKNNKKITPEEMKKMKEKDHRTVKGIFRCFEPVGGSFKFSFKKYAGDEVLTYTMIDGQTYDVPVMVAKHLNTNCAYPIHQHRLGEDGKASTEVGTWIRRCSFESLEFYDFEEEK